MAIQKVHGMKFIKSTLQKMNKNKPNNEQGFALLITLGILTGLLSLIVPLVLLNNYNSKQLTETPLETQGIINLHNGTTVALWSNKSPANGISKLQRNYSLPGWRNTPLPMITTTILNTATSTININSNSRTLIPAFMQVASCFDSKGNKIKLGGDLTYGTLSGFSATYSGAGTANHTGAGYRYIIIGNELIANNGGTMRRGLAGVQSAHKEGELIYVLPDEDFYLRVGAQYITIRPEDWYCDTNQFAGFTDRLSYAVGNSTDPTTIYFCKYKVSDNNSTVFVNSAVIDERSKLNLNSLSKDMITNLFEYPVGGGYSNSVETSMSTNWPWKNPSSIMESTGLSLARYSGISGIITTYSEPSYLHIKDAYSTAVTVSPDTAKEVLLYNAGNPSYSGTDTPFLQHPVNFNTASQFTIALILENIGGITRAEAASYAADIITHRSGENPNSGLVSYFNGGENPFDGISGPVNYGSPEAEFLSLFTDPTHAKAIEAHVYARHLPDYNNQSKITTPICFEFGLVSSITTSASVAKEVKKNGSIIGYKPAFATTTRTVVKDFNNWDEDNSGKKEIVLDSIHGWNEALSTFNKVDYRQPIFSKASTATHEITIEHATSSKDLLTGPLFGYPSGFVYNGTPPQASHEIQIAHVSSQANTQGNVLTLMKHNVLSINETGDGAMFDVGLRITNGNTFQGNTTHITGIDPAAPTPYTYLAGTEIALAGNLSGWPTSGKINVHDYTDPTKSGTFEYTSLTAFESSSNLNLAGPNGDEVTVALSHNISTNVILAKDYSAVTDAFYETCFIREGVRWDKIEVYGLNLYATTATLQWKTNQTTTSYVPTNVTQTPSNTITATLGETADMLFLKIKLEHDGTYFKPDNFKNGNNGSPQIFQIRITYTPPGKSRIIYSQEK